MTIAANAANVANNWSGGSVGSGTLYRGHSDNDPALFCAADSNDLNAYVEGDCTGQQAGGSENEEDTQRRTHTLSNGFIVWDLAGNSREWVNYFNNDDKPTPLEAGWQEYSLPVVGTPTMPLSALIPTNAVKSFWVDTWNTDNSIGAYNGGTNSSGGALLRGGVKNDGHNAGLFNARLSLEATFGNASVGFRCTFTVP